MKTLFILTSLIYLASCTPSFNGKRSPIFKEKRERCGPSNGYGTKYN